PATGRLVADAALHAYLSFWLGEPCPGNGRINASAKRTTMSPITSRFGQEMRIKPQWRYPAGWSLPATLFLRKRNTNRHNLDGYWDGCLEGTSEPVDEVLDGRLSNPRE